MPTDPIAAPVVAHLRLALADLELGASQSQRPAHRGPVTERTFAVVTQIRANALDELSWRGLVALSTDEDALRASLAAGPVTYYCGLDPTAPSLHMGNLVQLLTMRRLQDFGHKPIALVGGATGLIGDPRMSGERVLNDHETVAAWVDRIRDQVQRFLSFDGDNAAVVVNNLDWTSPMSALDFLREVGKNFRVNRMLAKESVSARLNSEAGISFTEFSYQLLQGMDFYQLYRRYGCTLQTGGSDQWGNLTAGADLTHRIEGISLHALATPLITKADGTKFGKTEGGAIWLDPEMTSPYAFYQFWLNAEDSKIGDYLKIFTFRSQDEIVALEEAAKQRPAQREAQRALAEDITTLVHGEETMGRVRAASQALFGSGDLTTLDASTLGDAVRELPSASISSGTHSVVDLFAATGLVDSKSAARRAVTEGGAYVNNLKVDTAEAVVDTTDLLYNRWILLRRGRKSLAVVEVG